ncbi:PspC domain-containing protein [Aureibacter tunicatorum]|uniref:Phage shock protein C n=1 Tax=Aureibacter tunicatorum TaxID=866807 RepID=A0AAE4BT09_9BACT|nr:PspC domain-containing protein [Aureibacter tunicatorum]MDR6239470.1 phage shock protein C [Aureibacter tunicatorum]BDD04608.1 hypothetical protein AUTU_20910 [Aureibacter tunicatorum]
MRLKRNNDRKVIAGVCSGIADFLGWDPLLVRILYVCISAMSGGFPGGLIYVVLWYLMPKE